MATGGNSWTPRGSDGSKVFENGQDEKYGQSTDLEKQKAEEPKTNRHMSIASVIDEKVSGHKHWKGRTKSASLSSAAKRESIAARPEQLVEKSFSRVPVRTIPPWIQSAREEDLIYTEDDSLLLEDPVPALIAQHNNSPAALRDSRSHGLRQNGVQEHPSSSSQTQSHPVSRWRTFARASAYPKEEPDYEKVDPEWLNANFTDYSQPWLANQDEDDVEDGSDHYHAFVKKRQVWYKRSQRTILRNPFIPLVFRLIVFVFAATALALGGSIHHITDRYNDMHPRDGIRQGPSTMMAIVVDAIALVYIVYVTYDEYFNKPLGLRSARAKVRIVLLDLFFIVFQAANLSLAFQGLSDTAEGCKSSGPPGSESNADSSICERQRALASVLLVALIAWLMTFSVSILRVVERINTK